MEVTALCFRLLMNVLMLLVADVVQSYPQTSDAALRINPPSLQFFEYSSVNFTCKGLNVSAGWKVRNIKESIPKCSNDAVTSTVTCLIDYTFVSDSGEYWCEGGGGNRSNTINITITGGGVILESPALPVMEGDAVPLQCRKQDTSSNLKADFYKDGHLIKSSSTGEMIIHSVSKSDEGFYKCCFFGAGESPESWLTVNVEIPKYNGSAKKKSEDSQAEHTSRAAFDKEISFSRPFFLLLWIVIAVILVLQLLVMGLLYWKKHLVLLQAKMNDPNKAPQNVDEKDKRNKEAADAADNLSLCLDTSHSTKPQTEKELGVSSFTVTASSESTDPPLTHSDPQHDSVYNIIEEETRD